MDNYKVYCEIKQGIRNLHTLTVAEMAIRADRRNTRHANFGVGVGVRSKTTEAYVTKKYGQLAGRRYSFARANENTIKEALFASSFYYNKDTHI